MRAGVLGVPLRKIRRDTLKKTKRVAPRTRFNVFDECADDLDVRSLSGFNGVLFDAFFRFPDSFPDARD